MNIPLLVGIIGHRKILEDQKIAIQDELSKVLDDLEKKARSSETEIKIVSSIAEGADRIGAQEAINRDWGLIIPLPMEPRFYEKDFPDSKVEFYQFLDKASETLVINGSSETPYDAAAQWIIQHCQILIAIWDGDFNKCTPGGTSHSVHLRLNPVIKGQSLTSMHDNLGPTYHISATKDVSEPRNAPKWLFPKSILCNHYDFNIDKYLTGLFDFNYKSKTLIKKNEVIDSQSQLNKFNRPDCDVISNAFGAADSLANKYQKKHLNNLKLTILLAFSAYLIQLTWSTSFMTSVAALIILVAIFLIYKENKSRIFTQYIEYRAFAEVLRIAYFWKKAGIETCPSKFFLNHHSGRLSWIRSSINSVCFKKAEHIDLTYVKENWVNDQAKYFKNQGSKLERKSNIIEVIAFGLFVLSGTFAVLSVFIEEYTFSFSYLDVSLAFLSSISMLVAGVLAHYKHIRAYEENSLRYKIMCEPMLMAQISWDVYDTKQKQETIEELGKEAVSEIDNWLQIHNSRPNKLMNW